MSVAKAPRRVAAYQPTKLDVVCKYTLGSFLMAGAAFASMNLSAVSASADDVGSASLVDSVSADGFDTAGGYVEEASAPAPELPEPVTLDDQVTLFAGPVTPGDAQEHSVPAVTPPSGAPDPAYPDAPVAPVSLSGNLDGRDVVTGQSGTSVWFNLDTGGGGGVTYTDVLNDLLTASDGASLPETAPLPLTETPFIPLVSLDEKQAPTPASVILSPESPPVVVSDMGASLELGPLGEDGRPTLVASLPNDGSPGSFDSEGAAVSPPPIPDLSAINSEFSGAAFTPTMADQWASRVAEVYPTLDKADVLAIRGYTTGESLVNHYLKSPASEPSPMWGTFQDRADATSAALSKLPSQPGTTFRGKRLYPEELERIQEGGTWADQGFLSTSNSRLVAEEFLDNVSSDHPDSELENDYGEPVVFVVSGQSGSYIAPLSSRRAEQEVLYQPGTLFAVEEKLMMNSKHGVIREVHLRELPTAPSLDVPDVPAGESAEFRVGDAALLGPNAAATACDVGGSLPSCVEPSLMPDVLPGGSRDPELEALLTGPDRYPLGSLFPSEPRTPPASTRPVAGSYNSGDWNVEGNNPVVTPVEPSVGSSQLKSFTDGSNSLAKRNAGSGVSGFGDAGAVMTLDTADTVGLGMTVSSASEVDRAQLGGFAELPADRLVAPAPGVAEYLAQAQARAEAERAEAARAAKSRAAAVAAPPQPVYSTGGNTVDPKDRLGSGLTTRAAPASTATATAVPSTGSTPSNAEQLIPAAEQPATNAPQADPWSWLVEGAQKASDAYFDGVEWSVTLPEALSRAVRDFEKGSSAPRGSGADEIRLPNGMSLEAYELLYGPMPPAFRATLGAASGVNPRGARMPGPVAPRMVPVRIPMGF